MVVWVFWCLTYQRSCLFLFLFFLFLKLTAFWSFLWHIYNPHMEYSAIVSGALWIPTDALQFGGWGGTPGSWMHGVVMITHSDLPLDTWTLPSTPPSDVCEQCAPGQIRVSWFGVSVAKCFAQATGTSSSRRMLSEFYLSAGLFLNGFRSAKWSVRGSFWLIENWACRPDVKTYWFQSKSSIEFIFVPAQVLKEI